ncbi:hypothetical protein C8R45DRAFT_1070890 [Mycena sanguinolenta]|nr:hypothetical protein C8R45DRAFT_1070890 [Mycena sanguinolenta]
MNSEPPPCRVCNKNYGPDDQSHFLLTCHQCNRSWHHRCHQPPIEDAVVFQVYRHFLASPSLKIPLWTCTKCSRKATALPLPQPQRVPDPEILDLDTPEIIRPARQTKNPVPEVIDLSESPAAPRQPRVQPAPVLVEEIIDVDTEILPPVPLAASPSDRPTRVQSVRAQAADIIDLEAELPRASNTDADNVIEILDSPPSVVLNLPAPAADLPLPPPAINFPVPVIELPVDGGVRASSPQSRSRSSSLEPTLSDTPTPTNHVAPVIVDPSSIEVDDGGGPRTTSGHFPSMSPSLTELFLSDTPTPTVTRLPSMDLDTDQDPDDQEPVWKVEAEETEQKPLSLLLQNLTVSDQPKGGTLGPAWMRYEASGELAKWDRLVERQKIQKPLRRKAAKPRRLDVDPRSRSFVVLPFEGSHDSR